MMPDSSCVPEGTMVDAKKLVSFIDKEIEGYEHCSEIALRDGCYTLGNRCDVQAMSLREIRSLIIKKIEEGVFA